MYCLFVLFFFFFFFFFSAVYGVVLVSWSFRCSFGFPCVALLGFLVACYPLRQRRQRWVSVNRFSGGSFMASCIARAQGNCFEVHCPQDDWAVDVTPCYDF